MKIIYPPLVEQSFRFYQEIEGKEYEKSELYRSMVKNTIITENGLPTEFALKSGFIQEFSEEEGLSFEEFLTIYPVFKQYSSDYFSQENGFWEMTIELKDELYKSILQQEFSYDESSQIEAYFFDRK